MKTKGDYRLTDDYSEKYLRAILLLNQIESTIDDVENKLLDYFSDGFSEINDEQFQKVQKEIEEKLYSTPQNNREEIKDGVRIEYIDQAYLKLEKEMLNLRELEYQNALNRYKNKFAEKQKIAGSELIRILENQFKEIVVSYSYLANEHKRGYITDLGIDEVLYYSHPQDKYNYKRLRDSIIGYCAEDYDEMYLSSKEHENDNDNYGNVIRTIHM